ncbi:MAG TPA: RidA family protein [Burkholderiales bacterium]
MQKQFFNPPELGSAPRAYSHAVSVAGPAKLVYVSGQIALGADGKVVGKGDMRRQCEQVFENVTTVLRASGAGWGDVVKMNAYMVGMSDENVALFREVRSRYLPSGQPPASTFVGVARLVNPELLLEVEVVAAL